MKKILLIFVLCVICLSGCGLVTEENREDMKSENTGNELTQQDSQNVLPSDSDVKEEYDLEGKLQKAEEDAAVLEDKLLKDGSLKQTDMNKLAGEIYVIWDDLLNDMWKAIKETLNEESMNTLLEEQREWITDKEDQVKQAQEAYGIGSMAPFAGDRKAAELTKARVYELAEYLK